MRRNLLRWSPFSVFKRLRNKNRETNVANSVNFYRQVSVVGMRHVTYIY